MRIYTLSPNGFIVWGEGWGEGAGRHAEVPSGSLDAAAHSGIELRKPGIAKSRYAAPSPNRLPQAGSGERAIGATKANAL